MPRLPPILLSRAARINRHLPLLLRECRDLDSARNELRWLREATDDQLNGQAVRRTPPSHGHYKHIHDQTLTSFVKRRARGEPLQYILGSQPFGELEIKCRPGVLIPRPETEIYTTELARTIQKLQVNTKRRHLSIVDFCTGTGCIALLLHALLKPHESDHHGDSQLQIRAFDISDHALRLSSENIHHNLKLNTLHEDALQDISFKHHDVLALAQQPKDKILTTLYHSGSPQSLDIIVSNPPYISPQQYNPGGTTTKSVRNFEPKLALVPPESLVFDNVDQADQFYATLLRIAIATKAKLLVMEVGDTEQALRVKKLCMEYKETWVEIWNDDSDVVIDTSNVVGLDAGSRHEDSISARVVAVWFDTEWTKWRKANLPM